MQPSQSHPDILFCLFLNHRSLMLHPRHEGMIHISFCNISPAMLTRMLMLPLEKCGLQCWEKHPSCFLKTKRTSAQCNPSRAYCDVSLSVISIDSQ